MILKKEDLIQICPDCDGKREVYDLPDGSARHPCQRCKQTGQIITDQGEVIISLINLAKEQSKINR